MVNIIVILILLLVLGYALRGTIKHFKGEDASAKVSLKKGRAVVSFDREIGNDSLYAAVEGAGFQVVSIEA